MANTITRRQGDTAQPLTASLTVNGAAVDLTGATVDFHMIDSSRPPNLIVDQSMTIVGSPTAGNVSYAWQTADVASAGTFTVEFLVTFADGTTLSFPNGTTNPTIVFTPAIGPLSG